MVFRSIVLGWLLCILPGMTAAQPARIDTQERFQELLDLRAAGRYREAIRLLDDILTDFAGDEMVLRRAYIELVYSHLLDTDKNAADTAAQTALRQFPDLVLDPLLVPAMVGDLSARIRNTLFGTIIITAKPDSCAVTLDNQPVGYSPLVIEHATAGEHTLQVAKPGYRPWQGTIRVDPGQKTGPNFELPRVGSDFELGLCLGLGRVIPTDDTANYGDTGWSFNGNSWLWSGRIPWALVRLGITGHAHGEHPGGSGVWDIFPVEISYRLRWRLSGDTGTSMPSCYWGWFTRCLDPKFGKDTWRDPELRT